MVQPTRVSFSIFSFFSNYIGTVVTVYFSRIQTQFAGVEGWPLVNPQGSLTTQYVPLSVIYLLPNMFITSRITYLHSIAFR